MKTPKKLFILLFISLLLIKCDNQVSKFGFSGSIQGKVIDANGNLLHGDLSNDNLVIKLLGKGDTQAIEIRVDGAGTYQNTKMFPKQHKVWVEGAIVKSDTVFLNFGEQPDQDKDFTVTPLIAPTIVAGSAGGTNSIDVEYSITNEADIIVERKEIYCSTVQYPTADIGSRDNMYSTKTVSLSELSGNVSINGLKSGEKYYLRIGSKAQNSPFINYSNQIEVTL